MARVICVANQKGGVGKTTTVINLAASLAVAQKRTMFIDFDPQANATSGVGVNKNELDNSVYNTIIGDVNLSEVIINIEPEIFKGFLNIVPANPDLTGAEVELITIERREWKLKDAINSISERYDYILIDCPPSLSLLTVNALTAADSVLVPVQAEYYALEGLGQLKRTLSLIKQRLNPELSVEGYLITMFDSRNNICRLVANELKTHFNEEVFNTVISRNVRLAESPSHGKPALLYDVKSSGAQSYIALAREIMARNGGQGIEKRYIG